MSESPNADRPIAEPADDLLGRGPIVEQLATWILEAPTDEGFVIGLTGSWGSGKTSVLHLLERSLVDDVTVIWFEPWLFTGADDLVERFFSEIIGQLYQSSDPSIKSLATRLATYGSALSPLLKFVNSGAAEALTSLAEVANRRPSVSSTRRDVRAALIEDPQRIVVLIDDVDRLDAHEVREVMRLVKLVADLPGVVHVLAYDRFRVEAALSASGLQSGRSYLEKIVQASVPVPPVPRSKLMAMSMAWLGERIETELTKDLDQERWERVLVGGLDRYIRTPRDGRRFANMAPAAVALCDGEVALEDVLALEAMRVFDPDFHDALLELVDTLFGRGGVWNFRSIEERAEERKGRAAASLALSTCPEAARHLMCLLFPESAELFGGDRQQGTRPWRQMKRVASHHVFLRYLHLALDRGEAPAATVEAALSAMTDGAALSVLLESLDSEQLADVIDRMHAAEHKPVDPDVLGSASSLYDAIPRLSTDGSYAPDPARKILWLIDDMTSTVEPFERRVDTAIELVETAPTLSLAQLLIYLFRIDEESPRRRHEVALFEASVVGRLEDALAEKIAEGPAEQIAEEQEILTLLTTLYERRGSAAVLTRLQDPEVAVAVLAQRGTRVRGWAGSRRVAIDLQPLVDIAGRDVLGVLGDLYDVWLSEGTLKTELGSALAAARAPADVGDVGDEE